MVKIKKIYLVFLAASFIFAVFAGGNLPYSIFYMMVIIMILSIIYTISVNKNLSIDEVIEKRRLSAGEETQMVIRIYNDSLFAIPYLELKSEILSNVLSSYRGDASSVKGNSTKYLKRNIRFDVRGIYNLGKSSYTATDLLGIITLKRHYENKGEVIVYPKIFPVILPPIAGGSMKKSDGSEKNRRVILSDGNETIKNIREYRTGDNYKRINWKLSAKHGKLYVKEYENSEGPKVNIFFDFRKESYRNDSMGREEEEMVEFFLSITNSVVKKYNKASAYILCDEEKIFACSSGGVIEEMKDYFLEHFSSGVGSISDYMHRYLFKISMHSAIVVVTNEMRRDTVDYFLKLSNAGYRVTVFYNKNHTGDLSRDDLFDAAGRGVECHAIEEIC